MNSTKWPFCLCRPDSRVPHCCLQAGLLQCTVEWCTGGDFWQTTARLQDKLARAEGAQTLGCSFAHYTGFRGGSGSPIKWLFWLTSCGPQPLWRISASWYRPIHCLGLGTHPMLRCWSFLAYTLNWPVTLSLLLVHPPGTLYQLTFDFAKYSHFQRPLENQSV